MNAIQTTANSALSKGPKVMGARGHAIMDYALIGATVAAATVFFPRNRAAGLAAGMVAKIGASTVALTDFPGGIWRKMSFQTHGQLELGIVALVAALPGLMGFRDRPEAKFFYGNALAILASSAMTDYSDQTRSF